MATALTDQTTIGEARAFAERARKALYEAGEVEAAKNVAVVIRPDGDVTLSTIHDRTTGEDAGMVRRAAEIDPEFEPVP